MNIKSVGIIAVAVLAAAYICAVVVWFDSRSADLRRHERDIAALQGGLAKAAQINETAQNSLIEDILDLDIRVTSSEADTRSLSTNTDRELRNAVERTEQNIAGSVRDRAREIAELLGLVEDTRAALEETQEHVDFLVAENEAEAAPEPKIIVPPDNAPISEAVVYIEEIDSVAKQENLERDYSLPTCPTSPNNASEVRRILTRAMERKAKKGRYPFAATFNINSEGATEDVVVTGDGPVDLHKAVARYASALRWTVDEAVSNCEFKLKLDIE